MHTSGHLRGPAAFLFAHVSPERSEWPQNTNVPQVCGEVAPASPEPAGGSWGSHCPWAHGSAVGSINHSRLYAAQYHLLCVTRHENIWEALLWSLYILNTLHHPPAFAARGSLWQLWPISQKPSSSFLKCGCRTGDEQTAALGPNSSCCLFLWTTFYWNTAMPILHSLCLILCENGRVEQLWQRPLGHSHSLAPLERVCWPWCRRHWGQSHTVRTTEQAESSTLDCPPQDYMVHDKHCSCLSHYNQVSSNTIFSRKISLLIRITSCKWHVQTEKCIY